MSDKYNGWTNYPTWCVHLWLTNDESTYEQWSKEAKLAALKPYPKSELSQYMKSFIRESIEETPDMAGDLLGYALDCVNWHEIASAFLEEVKESES